MPTDGIGIDGLAHGSGLATTGPIDPPGDISGTMSTDGIGIMETPGIIDAIGLATGTPGHGAPGPTGVSGPRSGDRERPV